MWPTKPFVFVFGANDVTARARSRNLGRFESLWVLVTYAIHVIHGLGAGSLPSRQYRWRARCVSKGARRVRREAAGNSAGKTRGQRRSPTLPAKGRSELKADQIE
jgi:hypothetical protein